jgi:hypothetical protein
MNQRRNTQTHAQFCGEFTLVGCSLVNRDRAVCRELDGDRRTDAHGKEETMRQVTRMHRTLTVLAVGLLALAAPLVAYANTGGPNGS